MELGVSAGAFGENVSGIWALPPLAFEFWGGKVPIVRYIQHFVRFGGFQPILEKFFLIGKIVFF